MPWSCALALLLSPGLPQEQGPAFVVQNPADAPRTEIVRVSMPFPRGRHRQLRLARIPQQDHEADACVVPLMLWPDGSIAVAQLQVRIHLGARERRRFKVQPAPGRCPDPGKDVAWHYDRLSQALPLFTEVQDPWGQTYRARS